MDNVKVFDSASGAWPLMGRGTNGILLTYVDSWGGTWNGVRYASNFLLARAKFPDAWCIQTSVVHPARPGVALYDCEAGALSVLEVCGVANTQLVKRVRFPGLYGSQSTRDEIVDCLATKYKQWELGRDIDFLLADPDGDPTIPPGNIGKQYSWPTNFPIAPGQEYDVSVVLPTWQALKPLEALNA